MVIKTIFQALTVTLLSDVVLATPAPFGPPLNPATRKSFGSRHDGRSSFHGARNSQGGSFSIDLVRNEAFQHNGPAEYAWACMKYGKTFPGHVQKTSKGPVSAVNQTNDREYLSPVYIGTPCQLTWLDLDTGSGDLWLFSSDTPSFYLAGQNIYNIKYSSTAVNVPNSSWSISYGDGSYAGGAVYRDTVRLGNITIRNATVESATAVSRSLTTDRVMSGIMGLALNHSSTTYPSQPTVLDALSPLMDANVFAVDLRYQDTGAYHFGYVNESAYTGDVTWRPVLRSSSFWEIHLQGIHIAGDNVWRYHEWPMVVDTGTTLMLLPSDLTQRYWSFVPGAYLSDAYFGWVYPCNETLPDFNLGFLDDGWNATIPGHYLNFQNITETDCYGGIQDSMNDFGILGDAFLKAFYVIFDIAETRVGLATKRLTA